MQINVKVIGVFNNFLRVSSTHTLATLALEGEICPQNADIMNKPGCNTYIVKFYSWAVIVMLLW